MKKIGLIGGVSCESSLEYYRIINNEVRAVKGGSNNAETIMYSLNMQHVEDLQFSGESGWERLNNEMVSIALKLQTAGVDCIGICSNLMHRTAPSIEGALSIPLIHIADCAAVTIKQMEIDKVGLMGAMSTMKDSFYKDILLERHGVESLIPEETEMQEISRVIYKELCCGTFDAASTNYLNSVAGKLKDRGAGAVILGCTELPFVMKDGAADIPYINTMELHAKALAEYALGE